MSPTTQKLARLGVAIWFAACFLTADAYSFRRVARPSGPDTVNLQWAVRGASGSLDDAIAAAGAHAHRSTAPRYFGAFGVIGISADAASHGDLMEFAEQLATDKRYRELVVRHISEEDCGVQFVYTGKDVDHSMVKDLIARFRKRFGRESVVLVNITSIVTSDASPRSLGIVAFRPL